MADSPPTISVILPTTNRPTLERTKASIAAQNPGPWDEVLVIPDDPPHNDWGCWARNYGIERARGDILMFIDDDDIFLPGAFATARAVYSVRPDYITIFRMTRGKPFNDTLWQRRDLTKPGEVSSQMFVVPNIKPLLGRWTPRYEGDYDFIAETARKFNGRVWWHDKAIARWRP